MKKKLLLASLFMMTLGVSAQNVPNLIENGDFEAAVNLTPVTQNAAPEAGTWAIYDAGPNYLSGTVQEETEYGKIVVLETTAAAASWYKAYLMQNIKTAPKAEAYRLSFDIKSTSAKKSKVTTQIYCGANNYAVKNEFDVKGGLATSSAATYEILATEEWQRVEVEYNFSQMCNNINSPSSVNNVGKPTENLDLFVIAPTTPELLAQCRLTIQAYKEKPNTLLVDNVKLEPVNFTPEPEPEPFDGGLVTNGDFEATVDLTPVTSAATPAKGDWAVYLKQGKSGFTITSQDETGKGKVLTLETTDAAPGWYEHYLMQKPAISPKIGTYRLSCDIKTTSTPAAKLSILAELGAGYALKEGFDKEATPKASGARYDFTATTEWQTVEMEYDFSQICNNINAPSSTADWAVTPATETDLASSCLRFNCANSKGTVLLIDNVKLILVGSEPEPEPELPLYEEVPATGVLLKDNNFNDITEITRYSAEAAKYLGTAGEWYFYAEKELAGIDDSKAELKSEEGRGNVVTLANGSQLPSWWGHSLIQRLAAQTKPTIYRLSFYAKSNANSKATVLINTKKKDDGKAEFMLVEGFDPIAAPTKTGARYDIATTGEWQYYECTFDFSQKCNNYNSPSGVGDGYAITPIEDEEFFKNCYLNIFNSTAGTVLEIDDVALEELQTSQTILNPGFEEEIALPIRITTDLGLGSHSGQWVLVDKGGKTALSVSTEAKSGSKSMRLDVTELPNYPRFNTFLAMDLYEFPVGDYVFKFASKSDKAEAPFRLDVYAYNGDAKQAITGVDGEILTEVPADDKGLKMFKTATSWVDYSQNMTIPENSMIRIFIRPNIDGLGSAGADLESLPISYWFDDFSLELAPPPVGVDALGSTKLNVYTENNALNVCGAENADIAIYGINGVMINHIENVTGSFTCPLDKGAYIVKVVAADGAKTIKVLIK